MIVNAEQALIGALMMEPRAIKDCGSIRPDMFVDDPVPKRQNRL